MPPRPVWPGYIPPSGLALLCGGHRYDTEGVALDIAARVTQGLHWPGGGGPAPTGDVLLIADEDPAEATVPGLRAHGADLGRVRLLERDILEAFTLEAMNALELAAEECSDLRLVVIDPGWAFLPEGDREGSMRALRASLGALSAWSDARGVPILVTLHAARGGPGKTWARHARSIIRVDRDGHRPTALVARRLDAPAAPVRYPHAIWGLGLPNRVIASRRGLRQVPSRRAGPGRRPSLRRSTRRTAQSFPARAQNARNPE